LILRKIEGERFSEVLPLWSGKTVVIIAGGASLTRRQVHFVRNAHATGLVECIAVNAAYLWVDFASVLYFADSHFFRWHNEGIPILGLSLNAVDVRERFASFAGQKCSIQSSGGNITDEAVHMMRNRDFPGHGEGLSLDPRYLVTGRNSGFQALNLAVLAGSKRIILVGFDGRPGIDGRDHFHGGHPRPTPEAAYPLYRSAMVAASAALRNAGVEVLNCTPGSAIDCFPRVDLEDSLNA